GAIHEGHLSLVRQAQDCADRIVASIFVNPLQFGANEDFNTYPRDEAEDAAKLTEAGVHLLYAPGPKEMYPEGFATNVHVSRLSEGLCGQSRPSHFDGVATVVAKLLLQCAPDIAIFGEKDYQQLLVIKRLVRDLDIPIEIAGAPIVREADGLALSSRNAYLSPNERRTAPILYRSLEEAAREIAAGLLCEAALEKASATLKEAGFRIDYLEARDPQTLATLSGPVETARLLVAAFLGKTRLIDNVAVPPPGT
ncbi:MAG: pantoate--beta-alanine ligase, partial [Pseudomonadota bacterium]